MTEEGFNRLLDRVEKPARYIGGEYNMQVKAEADLRFALCFPDVYEVGMSNLGIKIVNAAIAALAPPVILCPFIKSLPHKY